MTVITHAGMAVPDLDAAVAWYSDALGLDALGTPVTVGAGTAHADRVAADVLGPGVFRQAHLTSANGVALELFEFGEEQQGRRGLFHLCFVPPRFDRAAARIAGSGGRRTSRIWPIFTDAPYRMCYCEDPFGNTVELYSHSHERTYANR
jgi:catechol 2,3-dioxygenase-like lactoylglutathione lyase family enzyme